MIAQGKENDTNKHLVDLGFHRLITPEFEVGGIGACGPHSGGLGLATNVGIGIRS